MGQSDPSEYGGLMGVGVLVGIADSEGNTLG